MLGFVDPASSYPPSAAASRPLRMKINHRRAESLLLRINIASRNTEKKIVYIYCTLRRSCVFYTQLVRIDFSCADVQQVLIMIAIAIVVIKKKTWVLSLLSDQTFLDRPVIADVFIAF